MSIARGVLLEHCHAAEAYDGIIICVDVYRIVVVLERII